jgi:hypothetical protein
MTTRAVPTPEELQLDARAQRVYTLVTARNEVRVALTTGPRKWWYYRRRRKTATEASRTLTELGVEIIDLCAAAANESELRTIETFVHDLIDDLFVGNAHRTEDELDRDEQTSEARENALSLEIRIAEQHQDPGLAGMLSEAADADRAEALTQLERARYRDRLSRQLGNASGDRRLAAPTPDLPRHRAAARTDATTAI